MILLVNIIVKIFLNKIKASDESQYIADSQYIKIFMLKIF